MQMRSKQSSTIVRYIFGAINSRLNITLEQFIIIIHHLLYITYMLLQWVCTYNLLISPKILCKLKVKNNHKDVKKEKKTHLVFINFIIISPSNHTKKRKRQR